MDDLAPVFEALGSAARRKILDIVKRNPGCAVGQVAAQFDTTRIAVLHHLRQLEDCDLIISRKDGRVRRLYHNPVPIQLIYDRWTDEYGGVWARKMAGAKGVVDGRSKGKRNSKTTGARQDRPHDAGIEDSVQRKDRGRVA